MKKSKVNISLNDSDDAAFLFEIGTQKRKIKPISPKVKRQRGNNKDILTQSAIEKPNLRERKPQLNRSAPESTKLGIDSKEILANQSKEVENTQCGSSDLKSNIKNHEDEKKSNCETAKMVDILPESKDTVFSYFLSKAKKGAAGLHCPLCKKIFENSLSHVSHMKLCAKKKKVSITQLLQSVNTIKTRSNTAKNIYSTFMPSTSKSADHRPEGILNSSECQMTTLEKFGFVSSTGASKTGIRRGRLKINRNSVLKSRTTEERMRILTEKAAVILLTDEKTSDIKVEDRGSPPELSLDEIPSSLERPKINLWDVGNCDRSNTWYIDNIKHFVAEKNLDPVLSTNLPTEIPIDPISSSRPEAVDKTEAEELIEPALSTDPPSNNSTLSDHHLSFTGESTNVDENIHIPSEKNSFLDDPAHNQAREDKSLSRIAQLSNNINHTSPPTISQLSAPVEQVYNSETLVHDSGIPQSPEIFVKNQASKTEYFETARNNSITNESLPSPSLDISVVSETPQENSTCLTSQTGSPVTASTEETIPTQIDNHVQNKTLIIVPSKNITSKSCRTLSDDMGKLVGSSLFSDRLIIAKDGVINVHSIILTIRCPNTDINNLDTLCQNIKKSSLLIFLKYLYTDILDIDKITLPKEIIELSHIFGRPEVITILNEKMSKKDFNISETAVTPKQADVSMNFDDVHLSEADTVPVSMLTHDETVRNEDAGLAVVDLTQNDASDNDDPNDKSYWSLLRQSNDFDDDRSDILDKERELAKIQSFFESNNSKKSDSDEDFMIDSREREKIYNLSQNECRENDIFDSNDEEDIQVLTKCQKATTEIVLVSDDSEQQIFNKSTDDDNSNHMNNDFDVPFFEPFENDDFIDYNKTANLEKSPDTCEIIGFGKSPNLKDLSPSQSLVSAPATPRTPRKVLETPTLHRDVPLNSHILEDGVIAESPDHLEDEDQNSIMKESTPLHITSPSQHATPVATFSLSIDDTTPECLPGPSHPRSSGRKRNDTHLRRAVLSPSSRTRRSIIGSCEKNEVALSNSVVAALDETWQNGDESPRPQVTPVINKALFLEVTPNLTPSTKIVNKITPRPSYSSMKTGSLKKHLQKYGLKQNLGKVKAKKILRHIYDELHPYVNTKTGKFLKKLPGDIEHKGNTLKKNSSKIMKKKDSTDSQPCSSQNSQQKPKNVKQNNDAEPSSSVKNITDELNNEKDISFESEPAPPEKDLDESEIIDSEHSNSSQDDFDMDDFEEDDEDILTQANGNMKDLSAGEIIFKFINENQQLHESILRYEPIWINSLKRDIIASYKVRLKMKDLVSYLDSACIIWRSEAQAANVQKRNDRTKLRRLKRKEKMKKSSVAQC